MKCQFISRMMGLTLFVLSGSVVSLAQTAQITGRITDSSGAIIHGADVTVTHVDKGVKRETTSTEEGYYTVPVLQPGNYQITIEMTGFKPITRSGITLRVDQVARIDFTLEVGEVHEKVTVTGEAPLLVDTSSATLKTVVDAKRIAELPLNGRNLLQLMTLVAGVQPTPTTFIKQAFTYADVFVSSSGGRGNTVNFILDGGDNVDNYTNAANPFPNPDALQEFSFQTNNFGAEFGRLPGGVVNAVTKSGTNAYHGSFFEFLRNNALNANNFFAAQDDGLKRNQFGATFGGPIKKDKTFFFGSYQGTRIRVRPTTSSAFVPTADQRRGDFSRITTPIIDPLTRRPFAGNQIPVSRFDPASRRLMDEFIPVPDDPSGLLRFPISSRTDEDEFTIRIDQAVGSNNKFTARYHATDLDRPPTIVGKNLLSASPIVTGIGGRSLTINNTHVFNPRLLNNFNFTYNWQDGLFKGVEEVGFSDLGVNITPTTDTQKKELKETKAISLSVGGFFAINSGQGAPARNTRKTFQWQDSITYISGRHEIKFGADIVRRHLDRFGTFLATGVFGFSGRFTGNNLADFVLGLPSNFSQGSAFEGALRLSSSHFFVQDNVKLNSKLTLNLGLRYEPFLPWKEIQANQVSAFRPGLKSERFTKAPIGLLAAGDPGVAANGMNSDLNNWGPRFGFAYDPFGDGKTSIRAAYGIFYDMVNSTYNNRSNVSPPFSVRVDIPAPPSFSNPFAGGVRNPFPVPVPPPSDQEFVLPIVFTSFPQDFRIGYTQQWNFTIERQMARNFLARVAYVGSKGTHLLLDWEVNPAVYIPGQSTIANTNQRRPFGPAFSSIEFMDSNNFSTYNSLQLTMEKRFSGGYTVLANYTWQKSIDLQSNTVSPGGEKARNPFNLFDSKGRSDFDRTHRFVLSYLWELPSLKNWQSPIRHLLGGWQTNAIVTIQSGIPFTIFSGVDNSFSGNGRDNADLIGDPRLPTDRPRGELIQRYFNTAAFKFNTEGTFGTAGRNILAGPGLANVDFSIFKNIKIHENHRVQFRGEFFNLFNQVNLGNPSSGLTSPAFGRILGAFDPRIIQFAIKYLF